MFWRGVFGYLPANLVQAAVGVLTIVVFTRLLTPEQFGQYAVAFSVMTLAHVAVFTWLEASMARFWAAQHTPEDIRNHFAGLYRAAFASTALAAPVALLALWLWPADPMLRLAIGVGLAGAPIRCFAKLAQERFRAAGEVRKAALLDMWTAGGGFGVGVIFALIGWGGSAPLMGLALAPLAALPFILPGEMAKGRGGAIDAKRMRAYAAYGYPIAFALALTAILASTDRFLLAHFMDEAAVGAYHAGYSLANRTLDVMFIWLGAASGPALVMALERGGREALRETAREQAGFFILIGLPAAVGVMLVARPLADVLVGEALRADAAFITPWIALGALLSGMTTYYFGQAFTLARKTKRLVAIMAFPTVANIVLNLVLIPRFGVVGAAWATTASFGLGLLAAIVVGRRVMPLPIPWEALARCGVAAGLMALAVNALPAWGGPGELFLKAAVGGIVYAAVALTINAGEARDLMLRLIRSRRLREAMA